MPLQRRNPGSNYGSENSSPMHPSPSYHSDHESSPISPMLDPNPSYAASGRSHPAAHPESSFNQLRQKRLSGSDFAPDPPIHRQRPAAAGHQPDYMAYSGGNNYRSNDGGHAAGPGMAYGGAHGQRPYDPNGHHDGMVDNGIHSRYAEPDGPYSTRLHNDGYQSNGNDHPPSDNMSGSTSFYQGRTSPFHNGSERTLPVQAPPMRYQYEDPYRRNEAALGPVNPELINPNDILDDGDDGFIPDPKRRSVLSLGRNSSHNNLSTRGVLPAGAIGAGDGAGNVLGAVAGRVNGEIHGSGGDGPNYSVIRNEKSEWLDEEQAKRKKRKWIIGIIVVILLVGAIAGGVAGGILGSRGSSDSGGSSSGSNGANGSADDDTKQNGDLNKDSAEIKRLMGNPNLHKVFPGMDYTPWGTQYPLCLTFPPSQNNVTRDMAVLSQLTDTVRLYGTDCNQTELVLHAIDQLELKDMKLWLGVWIDSNQTTNDRQIKQMYNILDKMEDTSIFHGVIVGNEYLFREEQTQAAYATIIEYVRSVKQQFQQRRINLPVATSDLGAAWTLQLAQAVDVVMANIHPFFSGALAKDAAGWTYTYWTGNTLFLTKDAKKPQYISEVGWPTGGGQAKGSVAGIPELNQFLEDWVCQALKNDTKYFWFEAFDEPWKVQYNEPGKEWEDKWGLMDPARNLKPGVKIPDCGGTTAKGV
ncbi:hypothetical protein FQN57_002163 [Myotisia sp. PD_48]|nr:hypothetical protein FQN57_002163 [Myotisia sp. PD_48]